MAGLLRLYQQDAAAGAPALMRPVKSVTDWVEATKDYLVHLGQIYATANDVSSRHKKIADQCLNLAAQSLQVGASLHEDLVTRPPEPSQADRDPNLRRFGIILVLTLVLLLINLWVMSVVGVFSLFGLITALVLLHWSDIGVLERRLRLRRTSRKAAARPHAAAGPRGVSVQSHIESIVRRIDAIVDTDIRPGAAAPPASPTRTTLEFLQDMLEAKLADDKDYAFKKIVRTLEQVLMAEGIEVMIDAQNQPAMFNTDTVTDTTRVGQIETIRPALVKAKQCIVTGYAQRFVGAGDRGGE